MSGMAGWIFIRGCAVSCACTCWNVQEGDGGVWVWCSIVYTRKVAVCV